MLLLVMEGNVPANPANITLLDSIGIMLQTNRVANLIEEFSAQDSLGRGKMQVKPMY